MTTHADIVKEWRAMGPVVWAESAHGWMTAEGLPVRLIDWQRAVLLAWWELRALVRVLAISNTKKTGKTFVDALLLCWRWLALPGQHFAVGNDLDQSAGRQFSEIAAMVQRHPYLSLHCAVGKKLITFNPTGSTIEALPADAAGNAGANHLTASHTEAWAIIQEAGIRAWEELAPPPGEFYGFPALRIVDSYAGYLDESNTWHGLVDEGLAGDLLSERWPIYQAGAVLLFHMEGDEARRRCFRGTPAQAHIYYASERRTLRAMAWQRFHENKRTSGSEQFITEEDWLGIVDPELRPLLPTKGVPLYVGLDLAFKRDWAAVVGVVPNGRNLARLALHKIWRPVPGAPINLIDVQNYLRDLHRDYWLAGVYYDPSQAQLMAQQLGARGVRMVEVPQTLPELGPRGTKLWEAVRDAKLSVYESDEMKDAALAAVAREVPQGLHITKGANKRKIDPIAALSFCLPQSLDGETSWDDVAGLGHVDDFVSKWSDGAQDRAPADTYHAGSPWR